MYVAQLWYQATKGNFVGKYRSTVKQICANNFRNTRIPYKEIHLMLQSFSKHQSSANLWSFNMPVIEILNPQDPIPEVKSVYTALKGVEVQVDLNEDSWARDYFIIFFHTGPNDPVSTSILRYSLHSLRTLLMSLLRLSWAWWWCSGVSMPWTRPSPARWSPT